MVLSDFDIGANLVGVNWHIMEVLGLCFPIPNEVGRLFMFISSTCFLVCASSVVLSFFIDFLGALYVLRS